MMHAAIMMTSSRTTTLVRAFRSTTIAKRAVRLQQPHHYQKHYSHFPQQTIPQFQFVAPSALLGSKSDKMIMENVSLNSNYQDDIDMEEHELDILLLQDEYDTTIVDGLKISSLLLDNEDATKSKSKSKSKSNSAQDDDNNDDDDTIDDAQSKLSTSLREELRRYRIDQSSPLNKPAYTVFTNAALDEICAALPSSLDELLTVKGIGNKKLDLFGQDILDIVQRYSDNNNNNNQTRQSTTTTTTTTMTRQSTIPKPVPISIDSLTNEQRRAADRALDQINPQNVFISGAAGTGKSHVSKFIIQTLLQKNNNDDDDNENNNANATTTTNAKQRKCAPTAPTGVAAINVGGSTLHSFFGIGLGTGSLSSIVKKVRKNREALQRIDDTDVLLIDEVSMLSSELLEVLDGVAREVRWGGSKREEVMGGLQVIAVGDFFQLPPIIGKREQQQNYFSSGGGGENNEDNVDEMRPFCFDSPVWSALGLNDNTFELTEVQRQESGSKFEQFLRMVRVGSVTPNILRDFNAKCLIDGVNHPLPGDGIVPTRIYTHNRDVDKENESRLAELQGEMVVCRAVDEWREKMPTGTLASVKKSMKVGIAAEMPDAVNLKVGAQVMLTRNKDLEKGALGLVNGSRGVIERFDADQIPVVRFDNGRIEKIARVEAVRYNPDGGEGVLVRKQLPLKLAWATTVHKSQGSTLSRAIIDISRTFEHGQAYVSLSRVKDIEGLYLERPVRMENIMVSRRVLDYYSRTAL